jgi:hypothetical protein
LKKTKGSQKTAEFRDLLTTNIQKIAGPKAVFAVIFWIIGLTVVLWNETFYKSVNMLERWSFTKIDVPWTPPPTTAVPLWNGHYFGDFQLSVLYSLVQDPYNSSWPISAGLPGPIVLLKLFLVFPMKYSLLFFLVLSCFSLIYGLKQLLPIKSKYLYSVVLGIGFLNLPFFIALDRGNFIVLSLGLIFAIFGKLLASDRYKLSSTDLAILGGMFAIAASLKLYYLAFLPFFWLLGHKKFTYLALLQFCTFNVISAFFIARNLRESISIISQSLLYQLGSNDPMWILSGIGLPSLPTNILYVLLPPETFSRYLLNFRLLFLSLCVIWFLIVLFIVWKTSLRIEYKMIWILSLAQFALPTAMSYTALWATGSFILLIRVLTGPTRFDNLDVIQWYLLFLPTLVTLSPNSWIYWRQLIPTIWIVSIVSQLSLIRHSRKKLRN